MGYSNNSMTTPLNINDELYSDGCGCKYDEKYYVNGYYIDLCGLPIEEYMKSPCCGDSDLPSLKPINEISVKSLIIEDKIYYQAFAKYSVTSNIKMLVFSTTNVATELDIYVGDKESIAEIGETEEILEMRLNLYEDDSYMYIIKQDEDKVTYDIYTKARLEKDALVFSDEIDKITMEIGSTSDIVFTIPSTDVNYNEMLDIAEFEAFCEENIYCFVLYLPKSVYDDKLYSISNYGGMDVTDKFVLVEGSTVIMIDDIEYVLLNERAGEDYCPYIPLYGEDNIYEYKITLNNYGNN